MNHSDDAMKRKSGQAAGAIQSSFVDTGLDLFKPGESRAFGTGSSATIPLVAWLTPGGGATFKVWAPTALEVYLCYGRNLEEMKIWQPSPEFLLQRDLNGFWSGCFPEVAEGTRYLFWTVGPGGSGVKRDPRARTRNRRVS